MAYSTSNPPRLQSISPLTGAGQTWVYRSTDPIATVDGAGYITNAYDLGMKAGDLVIVMDTALSIISMSQVMTVTTSSAADLGTGTLIGSSANAD
jgi:hypothetical protein